MNEKYIAERSSAEYVDLNMQLRDVRCMPPQRKCTWSVKCDTRIVNRKQLPSRGRVEMAVIEIENDLNFYR